MATSDQLLKFIILLARNVERGGILGFLTQGVHTAKLGGCRHRNRAMQTGVGETLEKAQLKRALQFSSSSVCVAK